MLVTYITDNDWNAINTFENASYNYLWRCMYAKLVYFLEVRVRKTIKFFLISSNFAWISIFYDP